MKNRGGIFFWFVKKVFRKIFWKSVDNADMAV